VPDVAPLRSQRAARAWAGATVAVVAFALVAQLVLVVTGASVLVDDAEPPGLATRLLRFVSYFTVQSNALVLATTWVLVSRPSYDGRLWRIARADAIAGIGVTGVVHWFFLRPMFGPRRRIGWATVLPAFVWPAVWLAYTLVMGALTSWYPYPFLDVTKLGYGTVLVTSLGVAVSLVLVLSALVLLDSRLHRRAPLT